MDFTAPGGGDPHDEIVRLEARIEELADRIESCRKFMLASRIAVAAGGVLLLATLLGAIAFDATVVVAAIAAVLGGLVLLGSNRTTAMQAAEERADAEAERGALIEGIGLRTVGGRATLH